ncbi:MAG: thiamine phosphate synthase [Alphaproteobacteria bacterium]|nr:thiamine phosphate synthase [Alphaproteobacteria bacterium]
MTLPDPPVLVITDRRMAAVPLGGILKAVLDAGARWILVRELDLSGDALAAVVDEAGDLCARYDATLSVSADIDAAAAGRARGVHLPQRLAAPETVERARDRLGAGALIGISAHSLEEATAAQAAGADYVTLSPVFLTESKPGYGPALGLDTLGAQSAALSIPVVALGGIEPGNAAPVRQSGAAGIAIMGGIMRAEDPVAVMAALLRAWMVPATD